MTAIRRVAISVAALFSLSMNSVSALSIREFRKHTPEKQGVYVSAAVSMLAYTFAANGDLAKASCVKTWYFGKLGEETPGPRELAVEIGIAEKRDADRFHVEGVVLGVVEHVCGADARTKQ
jgi:hypothetical protein